MRIGGFVGLLDLYPNAAAAYSLRKLRAAYSGAAVRVRESGGNTEADIGFTSAGELDTTALLAHCGANDGFVTVWYDQSLSNNATQTTASNQPKIVSAGSLVTENSKAAIDFDGVDDFISLPSVLANLFQGQGKAISAFNVTSVVSGNTTLWSITDPSGSISNYYFSSHDSNFKFFARGAGGTLKTGASSNTFAAGQYLKIDILPEEVAGVQNGNMYIDGAQEVASFDYATASKTLTGGGIGALVRSSVSGYFNGNHQEIVLYPSDQSTNRTGIETNINDFYSIF